jgi:hypothetical protein
MAVGNDTLPDVGAPKGNDAHHVDTLPWGTPGVGKEPAQQDSDPVDQGVAQRQRSTQRLTKPDRPVQPGESISPEPVTPKVAARSKPQGAAEQEHPRPMNIPPVAPNRSQIYALWIALLVAIGLLVLILVLQSGDSQQSSSDALPPNDPVPSKVIVTMDAAPVARATPEDAGAAEGTLNMDAEPSAATLQVFANASNVLVFEGQAPQSLRLPVGQYRVLTEHKGYFSNMTIVEVNAKSVVGNKVVLLARPKRKSVKPKPSSAPVDDDALNWE